MARRKLIWHIGLAHAPRPVIEANLAEHGEVIEEAGVRVVGRPPRSRGSPPTRSCAPTAAAGLVPQRGRRALGPDLRPGLGPQGRLGALDPRPVRGRQGPAPARPRPVDRDRGAPRGHPRLVLAAALRRLAGRAAVRGGRPDGTPSSAGCSSTPSRAPASTAQAEEYWAGHELVPILARWGWTFHADRLHVVAAEDVTAHWRELRQAGRALGRTSCRASLPPYAGPAGRRGAPQGEPPAGVADRAERSVDAARWAPTRRARPRRSCRRRRCGRWSSSGRRTLRAGRVRRARRPRRCSPRRSQTRPLPGPATSSASRSTPWPTPWPRTRGYRTRPPTSSTSATGSTASGASGSAAPGLAGRVTP